MCYQPGSSRSARVCKALVLFMSLLLPASGFTQESVYGQLDFANSGSAEAQGAFTEGLLMLHSFQYEDARESFHKAQAIDQDFAMAYWGEAMTYNYPLWPFPPDKAAALAALAKLGKTPSQQLSRAPTEREKDYIAAVQILFGDGEKKERDFNYLAAMETLAEKYPDDLDAALFLALAKLGTSHGGRDFSIYMKAAAITEEVFAKNPLHPGAAHYMIHCYDDPVHAPLGLRAAHVYAKIAPSASHAQHMPSHIFFALGMWDEASISNVDAYESDKERARRKGQKLSAHGYHAIWWLLYSKLQEGKYADAKALIDDVEKHYQSSNIKGMAQNIVMRMNTLYALETGQLDHDLDIAGIRPEELNETSRAAYLFVRGMDAIDNDRLSDARKNREQLNQILLEKADAGSEVLLLELSALIRQKEGNMEAAIDVMKRANSIEGEMPMDFGPPWPTKSSYELHGEMLIRLRRPEEAMAQFRLALARAPKRAAALLGLARSAALAGQKDVSLEAYRDLNAIWSEADRGIAGLEETRSALQEME